MNRKFLICLTVSLLFTASVYSMTGDEAVARFKSRINGVGTMSGVISWTYPTGQMYTGSFKYMAPGRIFVKFSSPQGKIIVSNGKKLWIYDSGSNICGIQELAKGGSGGLAGLIAGYNAILSAQGAGGYTIRLKGGGKTYNEITLVLDASFMFKKAVLRSEGGEGLSISLSNVNMGEKMHAGLFDFNVPSNAQVVKDPLDIK